MTYTNPRFGTTADYPADLMPLRDPSPENGDGQGFRSRDDRAHLLIYGTHNAMSDTPKSYLETLVDQQGITYKHSTTNFFVASGIRNGSIFYQRCNFTQGGNGIIDCIHLTYPAENKSTWDPIVTRISRSLRFVKGIEQRN